MTENKDTLKRYALEFIRESGSTDNIKQFVLHCNLQNDLSWSEESFKNTYESFFQKSSTGESASRQPSEQSTDHAQPPNPTQNTPTPPHCGSQINVCDLLLLNFLFSSSNHTTNIIHVNNGETSNQSENQESKDDKKSSAFGVIAVVLMMIFHGSICYLYRREKTQAREEEKIDYLDNKLKMFRNIEFAGCAVSLILLIVCTVYPVLPTWGLIALGVNALACAFGGWAFDMKHEEELKNIKKAEDAVNNCVFPSAPPPESGIDSIHLGVGQQYPSTYQTQATF